MEFPSSGDTYSTRLTATRATQLSGKEFERLAKLIDSVVAGHKGNLGEMTSSVRHSPGRCVVQIGNAALTFSWVRPSREETAAARLMVLEWDGQIEKGRTDVIPERMLGRAAPQKTAQLVREAAFTVEGESDAHWFWRSAESPHAQHESEGLAATFITTLVQRAGS
jgi:hypothetical protein